MSAAQNGRTVRIFRYDPYQGGEGRYESFTLPIANETKTTILDVLLQIQREQEPSISFRYACRVNMCGSCALVINGKERLACKTNVSHIPAGEEITIRPLNHFPVVKDLVVDMGPFFEKYEKVLPFYQPKEQFGEPAQIRPDSRERQDIGASTECITCGCCVSSCTMVHYHDAYAGPAALNRAFTLLADSRDGLFEERLDRALESCYSCRTEFNCTEVCPKGISSTRAIKYIQRLALQHRQPKSPELEAVEKAGDEQVPPVPGALIDRRAFVRGLGTAAAAALTAVALGVVGTAAVAGPALTPTSKLWVPVARVEAVPIGEITTVILRYAVTSGIYQEQVATPVLISRTGDELVCFNSSCTHLGCQVRWDGASGQFRCACHGGTFDRNGNVVAGPPPRPLDRYVSKVESGQLLVEVG